MPVVRWNRILITGAAGRLGSQLRTGLRDAANVRRLTDVRELAPATAGEEVVMADLQDFAAVQQLMVGVDLVLHFGAVMVKEAWSKVLPVNIVGTYNVFEAARLAGVRRIVYASSSHAVGMYGCNELLDANSPPRPDTPYGLSKAFGENLARMYFDKYEIEAACLRIGSCFEEATDERMLATWLSHKDLVQLCRRCIDAPVLGYAVAYGMSDNPRRWWDNRQVDYLGYRPEDSAEVFMEAIMAHASQPAPFDPATLFQGGQYVLVPDRDAR